MFVFLLLSLLTQPAILTYFPLEWQSSGGGGGGTRQPDPAGYEGFFEKYRKMLKMGLPEGSIRNKATQDGCSDEVLDYFFSNCATGQLASAAAAAPAPPAAPQVTFVALYIYTYIYIYISAVLTNLCFRKKRQKSCMPSRLEVPKN
jgi:hypothetical protein